MAGPAPFVGKITQKAVLFGPQDRVLLTRVGDHWEPPGGTFAYGETLVGGHPPFEAVTDPYDGTDVATEELLAALERARRSDGSSEE